MPDQDALEADLERRFPARIFFSPNEVAALADVSLKTLYRREDHGLIVRHQPAGPGTKVQFHRSEVLRLMRGEQTRRQPAPQGKE